MKKNQNNISSFEDFVKPVNESSFQIMHKINFLLTDLMKSGIIVFDEQVTTDDVKRIHDFFVKSTSIDDSLNDDVKTKVENNNLTFEIVSREENYEKSINIFADIVKNIAMDISNNFYAKNNIENKKVKNFVKKFYGKEEV